MLQLIDDQTASNYYNEIDTATGDDLQSKTVALEAWANNKKAVQSRQEWDHVSKVFTDFDNYSAAEGLDDFDEESRYQYANRKFIANQTGDTPENQMFVYPSKRDEVTDKMFGKTGLSEKETFDLFKHSVESRTASEEALRELPGVLAQGVLKRAGEGKPFDEVDSWFAFSVWKDRHADKLASMPKGWETAMLDSAVKLHARTVQLMDDVAPESKRAMDTLMKFTRPEDAANLPDADRADVENLAKDFAKLTPEKREGIYATLSYAAEAGGAGMGKGFWEKVGEGMARGGGNIYDDAAITAQDRQARQNISFFQDLIDKPQAEPDIMQTADSIQMQSDMAQKGLEENKQRLGELRVMREIRDLAQGRIDPIKTEMDGVLGQVVQGAYDFSQSAAYTGMAMVPYVGLPAVMGALANSNYLRMLDQYPDMDADAAFDLSLAIAGPQAVRERFQGGLLLGKLPFLGKAMKKLTDVRVPLAARIGLGYGAVVGLETGTELIQEAMPVVADQLAAAVREDMPEFDAGKAWGEYREQAPKIFYSMLWGGLMGGGAVGIRELERSGIYMRNLQELEMHGITGEAAQDIAAERNPDAATALFREAWDKRSPEDIQAGIAKRAAMLDAAQATQANPDFPTRRIEENPDGTLTHIIEQNGQTIYSTNDPAAADMALIEQTRRVVSNDLRLDTSIISEVLDQWTSEDPTNVAIESDGITAQQKLEKLQAAGNVAQIEELHRRIATSQYRDTPYDQINILGEATVEDLGEMVFRGVVTLNQNSRPEDAREEIHHVAVRKALMKGSVTLDTLRGWLDATETALPDKFPGLIRENENDIVESLARVQRAYEDGTINAEEETSLPASFVNYIKRMLKAFKEVLQRAVALRSAFKDGILPSGYETFLADSVGLNQQARVDTAGNRVSTDIITDGGQMLMDFSLGSRANAVLTDTPSIRASNATITGPANYSIAAHHGTPHKVDKFSTAKIGTGEGAQAYGWGLYFAQGKAVAEQYQKNIKPEWQVTPTADGFRAMVLDANLKPKTAANFKTEAEATQWAENETGYKGGNLYTVDLDVELEDLLDWDKPLSEQGEKVKGAFNLKIWNEDRFKITDLDGIDNILSKDATLGEAYQLMGEPKDVSLHLLAAGIPGIRYLDGNSRSDGEGTYNYVIFDENLIKITEKNGNRITASDALALPSGDAPMSPAGDAKDINYSIGQRSVLSEIDRVLDMPENPPSVPTAAQEGGKVRSIAKLFHAIMDGDKIDYGAIDGEGMAERISQAGDRILDVLLRASYEFPKFASWYESRLKMALDIFTQLDPDVANPDNESALLITLAITSNGADVATQTEDGWDVYNHWKQSGKLAGAEEKRGSQRGAETENKLVIADKIAGALGGYAKLGEFLNRKGTVAELRTAMAKQLGDTFTKEEIQRLTNGELVDEVVPFSLIFGPKLGSFFNNMSGDFSTITMDRWFMRTFGRTMGTQLIAVAKDVMAKKDARLKQALKGYKGDLLKKAGIAKDIKNPRQIAEGLGKFFQKKENRSNLSKPENEIRLASNDLFKVADGFDLNEAPDNGTHRRWIRAAMTDAIAKFNAQTQNPLVPAEAQALLWYYEKLIHETYGSRQKDASPDYASAANKLFIRERGTGSDRFRDSDGIKRRSGGGRSQAFGGLPSSSQSGAAANYSIASQSEIDRVNKALGAMNRGPDERLKVYERAKAKLIGLMQSNQASLDDLKKGTVSFRRTQVLQALGELDAILSIFPPDLRGRVGGYTKLASIAPHDVFKDGEKISEVSGMNGAIISAWMREGQNIGQAGQQSELPPGYTAKENLGTARADRAISDFFKKRIEMIDRELEKTLRREYDEAFRKLLDRTKPKKAAPGEKPKGIGGDIQDLFAVVRDSVDMNATQVAAHIAGLDSMIASGELTAEQEARAQIEAALVALTGDWKNADSDRRRTALTEATRIWSGAYAAHTQKMIRQREEREIARAESIIATGKDGDMPGRASKAISDSGLKGTWKDYILNLLNFDQVVGVLFGENSEFSNTIIDKQRLAENAKEDGSQTKMQGLEDFFSGLAGGNLLAGERLRYQLTQPSMTVNDIQMSQLEGLSAVMMWAQEDGRRHMEGERDENGRPSGKWNYDQAFVDEITTNLSAEALALRDWLSKQYAAEYANINAVYSELNGVNLPQIQNYSPVTVQPVNAPAGQVLDPVSGSAMSGASTSPGALRTRGTSIAEPRFQDALQTYIAHTLQMEHWKAFAPMLSEVNGILRNRDVQNSVQEKGGIEARKMLNSWLDYFGQGGTRDAGAHLALNQGLNNFLGRASQVALVGRISTLLIQSTQLGAALAEVPAGPYLKRMGKLLSGQLSWDAALNSDYIQRRIKQMPPVVQMAMQGLKGAKPTAIQQAGKRLGMLLSGADGLFTAGTYAIVYDWHLSKAKELGLAGQQAEDYARNTAERATDRIAQPTRAGARSLYENTSTNPLARAGWAFASEARKNFALVAYSFAERDTATKLRTIAYVLALNAIGSQILRSIWRDTQDDDDEELFDEKYWNPKRFLMAAATEPLYGIPVFGSMLEEAVYKSAGEYNPQTSLFSVAAAVGPIKRLPDHLSGDTEMRDVFSDIDKIISSLGVMHPNIAATASITHLAKDLFGLADSAVDATTED
jgi:hypothetical protein